MDWSGAVSAAQDAFRDTFGEPVEYRVGGTAPGLSVSGIFNEVSTAIDMNTGAEVTIPQPNVGLKLSDLQGDSDTPFIHGERDRLVIRGVLYRISNAQADGEGMVKMNLHRASS